MIYCFTSMKLAYFSPLNPQPSGISDYSEELLPFLAAEADITLFVDGFEPSNQTIRDSFKWLDYQRDPSVLETLDEFDVIIYHMGNDHRYHAGILEVMRAHPGIVVFHDFALQDFFLGLSQTRGRLQIYLEELMACHGERATRQAAEAIQRGSSPPQVDRPTEYPLNCRLARKAEGIIVHSEWSRSRFAVTAPGIPVQHIKMPTRLPKLTPGAAQNGNANGVVQIANFGLITPGKGIQKALRALSRLKADHKFHYTLVGQPNSFFDVRSIVREHDMEDCVTITGHVSLEEFEQRIAATDIALNLRERTVGETSASLCRIMAAGVPAVVFNVGAFSELPDDAVIKIDHDGNADALLEAYLKRLIEDGELRLRIGQNAFRYMAEYHAIETAAADYAGFAREVIARRPRKSILNKVAAELSSLGVSDDQALLAEVAAEVALLIPASEFSAVRNSNGRDLQQSAASDHNTPPVRSLNSSAANSAGRLPKIEGIDYKRAALDYPRRLDAERSYYLRTKPFYNLANKPDKHLGDGMDAETHRHFTDFANMASALALPAGARILDVGCGSGWLGEYFARLGYDVTGIDISEELIAMARERLARVPYDVDHETQLRCRFLTHDIETGALDEKFDAVICYDSLHHFEDERSVFQNLSAMLDVGGLLFILEGHKPSAGSATEDELQGVMRQYGTLESPFSTDYLRELISENCLVVSGDYVSVNGLFERELIENDRLPLQSLATDYHYLTCVKVAESAAGTSVPDSRNPGVLLAEFSVKESPPERVKPEEKVGLSVEIRNAGDTLWLTGQNLRAGIVMPGVRIFDEHGHVVSETHGHPPLPRPVAPGQSLILTIPYTAPFASGKYTLKLDLVDQQICWFEERGSEPLVFSFEVVETD